MQRIITIYRFRLGSTNVIILSGYDVMKEAIVEKADYFSDRPTWLTTLKDLDREAGVSNSAVIFTKRGIIVLG